MRAPHVLALAAAVLGLGGCAKFPADGQGDQFTRLRFRFKVAGAIDPNSIYLIAIRPLTQADLDSSNTDLNQGPIPVAATSGNSNPKNGFVEGRPTRFVRYDPTYIQRFLVYRFGTRTPTPNDPNPIDLSAYTPSGDILTGSTVDPLVATGSDTDTFGFDITTQNLVDDASTAQSIVAIQWNVITTNKALRVSGDESGRVTDAFGDQASFGAATFNAYRQDSLVTSAQYSNTRPGTAIPETERDTFSTSGSYLPSIDIVDWSLDVRTP